MKRLFSILTGIIFLFSCEKLIIQPNGNETERNIKDFYEIQRIISTDFPYLDSMKINWDSICFTYKPLVEKAKGDEIDKIFVEMLSNLKDGHTQFTSRGASYATYTNPHLIKDFYSYSPEVVRRYFSRKLKVVGKIEYEIVPQNVGYLHLTDFAEGNWLTDFDNALIYCKDTKGMIFDLRHNNGGDVDIIHEIEQRFVDKEMISYRYSKINKTIEDPIKPNSITYVKPVVILINGCSASAAEDTPAFLEQLSNVTLIGDSTMGIDGDFKEYNLPSGKVLQTIFEYVLCRGKHYQCIGVTPDILIPQTENDIKQGKDKQLEYAIDFLK
jgi:hypothetical protein